MAAKELIGKLGLDTTEFQRAIKESMGSLKQLGKRMQEVGKTMTFSLTAPIAAFGAMSIKAASDSEETFSKFATVFRDVGTEAETAFQTLRNEYGLSSTAAKQLLGDTGDLLTGFGFSQSAALNLSTEVNKLAVDLASFTNFSGGARGASEALTKALLGERESVKALGISILEEDVKRQMAINSMKGLTFESERQAKAYATLQLAQQQSQNAIGDYARTSDGFANQFRLLRARVEDLAVSFGEILLPLANKLVGGLTSIVNALNMMSPAMRTGIIIVAALVAAIGPLLAGLGFLSTTIIPGIVAGFAALSAPVVGAVAAIAAVVAAVVYLADNWDGVKERISDWSWWKNMLISMVQFLIKFNPFGIAIKQINMVLRFFDQNEIPDPFNKMAGSLESLKDETKEYKHEMGSFTDAVKNAAKFAIDGFNRVTGATKQAKNAVDELNGSGGGGGAAGGGGGGGGMSQLAAVTQAASQGFQQLAKVMPLAAESMNVTKAAVDEFNLGASNTVSFTEFLAGNIQGVQGAFQGMFETMLNGGNVFQFIGQMLKRLIAQLAAAAVAAAILSALLPGMGASGANLFKAAGGGSFMDIFKFMGGLPFLANGGITTGPTLAMVGDNRSGKEAIIPFERMGQFLAMAGAANTSKVEVTGVLRGEDLYLSSQNYINRQNRRLG